MKLGLFAIAAMLAGSASAQQAPSVIVVDTNRIATECTACETAADQLKAQAQGLQSLQSQLAAPLESEGKALEASVKALNGKEPDAALQARIQAFQTKEAAAQRQLSERAQSIERNQAFALDQIRDKLKPAVEAVRARRNATLVADAGSALAYAPGADATSDVLAELNKNLLTINVTAPLPAASSQGR